MNHPPHGLHRRVLLLFRRGLDAARGHADRWQDSIAELPLAQRVVAAATLLVLLGLAATAVAIHALHLLSRLADAPAPPPGVLTAASLVQVTVLAFIPAIIVRLSADTWHTRPTDLRLRLRLPSPRICRLIVAVVLVLLVALMVVLLLTGVASAVPPPPPAAPDPAVANLDTVIKNMRNWLIGILAGVATLFFSIGGLRYMGANGDPAEIERAKGAFKSAGVGYGLAILSPLFLTALRSVVGG